MIFFFLIGEAPFYRIFMFIIVWGFKNDMNLKIIIYSHHSLLLRTCYYADWSKCVDVLSEEKGSHPYVNFFYLVIMEHSVLETLIWTVFYILFFFFFAEINFTSFFFRTCDIFLLYKLVTYSFSSIPFQPIHDFSYFILLFLFRFLYI